MSAHVPTRCGPYLLLGEIARGGMAEIQFAVREQPRSALVAIKRILPSHAADPNYRRYFAAESLLNSHLQHPNVVRTLELGEAEGAPFLALEYIHGRALNRLLYVLRTHARRLPIPHAVFIAIEALRGLHYIHQATDASGRPLAAIVCDLSPSNIMVGYDGQVKVIDFGIATSRARFFEQIGMMKGKRSYMPPEQLRGLPLDQRVDVFAMAICLIELLTSEAAFSGKSEFEVEESIRNGRIPPLNQKVADLPAELDALIHTALHPDPARRPPTAAAFAESLAPFARIGRKGPVTHADVARLLDLYVPAVRRTDDERLAAVQARAAALPSA